MDPPSENELIFNVSPFSNEGFLPTIPDELPPDTGGRGRPGAGASLPQPGHTLRHRGRAGLRVILVWQI